MQISNSTAQNKLLHNMSAIGWHNISS